MIEYVVTASALQLRSAPALADNVIGRFARGQRVELLAQTGHWMQVKTRLKTGWVAAKYLSLAAAQPVLPPSEEFAWMPLALAEKGVREVAGPDAHPRIVEYLSSCSLDQELRESDETPWCSAFVNWCVEKSGHAGTNSAAARSWLYWGHELVRPRRGAVCVLRRDAAGRKDGGHVGFFVETRGEELVLFGGNQENQVGYGQYALDRLLGWRVP